MKNTRASASYFYALPALIFIGLLSIFPFLNGLIISLKDYEPIRGIMGSEFNNFANYAKVLDDPNIYNIFKNSFILGFLPIVTTVLLAFVLILCITGLKYRWLKLLSITVLAVPMLLSSVTLFSLMLRLFDTPAHPSIILLMNPKFYTPIFIVISSLHEVAIPVILGVLVCELKDKFWLEGVIFTLLAYTLVRLTMVLSPDLDLILASYNPLVYQSADVLDSYIFRVSVQQGGYSHGSVYKVLQSIVQIPLSLGALFLLFKLSPHLPKPAEFVKTDSQRSISPFGIIGIVLLIIGGIALLFRIIGINSFIETDPIILKGCFNSIINGFFAAILFGIISILLAYPLFTKDKKYFLLLALITIMQGNNPMLYLLYDALGLIDTQIPTILAPLATAMGAFAIYYSTQHKFNDEMPSFTNYIKNSVWPTLVIMVLTFIRVYNAFFTSISYVRSQEKMSLGYWTWKLNVIAFYPDTEESMISIAGVQVYTLLLSTIIPIALGIVLIWASKKLPLSAFSVQSRK